MSDYSGPGKMPTPDELQKEVEQFLSEKYGQDNVRTHVDSFGTKETEHQPDDEEPVLDFTMTPQELEAYLNQYVVRQEPAIEILSTKVATHFNRMRWERDEGKNHPRIPGQIKPNIMMIGPTGVGKTYIIKLIADRLGVPFVKGDATKFSETGYVGGDVEDLVRDLVRAADGNIKTAEYGIIYIDEIDKIAATSNASGPDVSRTGVQRNLLKLMEETEVELRVPHDLASQMEAVIETQKTGKAPKKKVNTRNILFIVSGAFGGLDKIVLKRLNRQPMGFGGDINTQSKHIDELMDEVNTQDLIEYGFESEFIGRLPVIAHLQDLDEDGLFEVLTNDYNAVVQGKIRDFAAYGIELTFTDEALRMIAQQANHEKTGARGLTRVTERVLIPFEKRLPSTPVRKLTVTREAVNDPLNTCLDLVLGETLKDAITSFKEKTNISLTLSPAAKRWLQENMEDGKTPGESLLDRIEPFQYAFNLLKRDSLQVTVALLENPKEYLESMIKKSYKDEK
ncbi:AAA family ATPase [bacterium]|nr:AAA family ATPase [bacterium]